MTESLLTKSLTLSYGDSNIIEDLNLSIPLNEITVLIGANGCGKSTLLRSIARLLKPKKGSVLLDGEDIFKLSTKQVAKNLSILPQSPVAPEGLTVLRKSPLLNKGDFLIKVGASNGRRKMRKLC